MMNMHTSAEPRLAALLVVLAGIVGTAPVEAADKRKYLIDPVTTAINGINIATKEPDILKRLGKPRLLENRYSELASKPSKYLHYDGIKIYLIESNISNLSCTGKKCQTDRGVKVGDNKATVIRIYGSGNQPYSGSKRDTLSYPLKNYDSYLFFVFKNDVVSEIEFWSEE
jgi:hypothetical protein